MTEREWREASDLRRSTSTLLLILVVAAALRLWGIGSGIPFAVGVDEPEIMHRVLIMMRTGDFNPHFFHYPTFYIYLQLALACARFLVGAMGGAWTSLDQVTTADFYLWGRALTAAFGTLTVLFVHQIGLRWGARHAALGAGLMAVMPLHVRESHYVLTDVPATCLVTLTWLLAQRAHEQPRLPAFAMAGASAGLAAATKYPAALALLLPLLAVWMTAAPLALRSAACAAVIAASAATFLLAAPFTVLDLPGFLNGYAHLAGDYTAQPLVEPAGLTYLKHLRNALQWPAFLLVIGGIIFGAVRAVRGPGRLRWTLAVTFPLLYFWFISGQSLVFGRYLLPLVPFLCVLAGVAVVSGVSVLRRFDIPRAPRTVIIAALTIAALLPPALSSINFSRLIARTGTTELAYRWILANVPRDARVVIETRVLLLDGSGYRAVNVPHLIDAPGAAVPRDYERYRDEGYEYFVASSQAYGAALNEPHLRPGEYSSYMRLFGQSQELARFTPTAEHPGPELRLFKLR